MRNIPAFAAPNLTTPSPRDAYRKAQRRAAYLLTMLTKQLEAHQDALDPAHIHWGHVGDITSIVVALEPLVRTEDI
jgi:hypothetical protein